MAKRFLYTILLLLLLLGGIFAVWGWNLYQTIQKFSSYRPPATSVAVATASLEKWHNEIQALGTLESTRGINVTPETTGIIKAIAVESGHYVREGQLLFQMKDTIEQAELRKAQAEAKLAAINYRRLKKLVATNAAPSSEYDKASAQLQQARAVVEKVKAIIQQKRITAPFAGKLGIINAHLGEFVSPSTKPNLVSLQSMNPLFVRFSVPEHKLANVHVKQTVRITTTNQNKIFSGRITSIDATVDPQTHNVTVQALVPNPKLKLYPGLFADVTIQSVQATTNLTIPKPAVTFNLYGNIVYVVYTKGDEKFVERRYVKTGQQNAGKIAILSGLKPHDTIVTAGHQKLHDKSRIVIDTKAKINL
jgi:membrane fusion protein, multidrug efflux system